MKTLSVDLNHASAIPLHLGLIVDGGKATVNVSKRVFLPSQDACDLNIVRMVKENGAELFTMGTRQEGKIQHSLQLFENSGDIKRLGMVVKTVCFRENDGFLLCHPASDGLKLGMKSITKKKNAFQLQNSAFKSNVNIFNSKLKKKRRQINERKVLVIDQLRDHDFHLLMSVDLVQRLDWTNGRGTHCGNGCPERWCTSVTPGFAKNVDSINKGVTGTDDIAGIQSDIAEIEFGVVRGQVESCHNSLERQNANKVVNNLHEDFWEEMMIVLGCCWIVSWQSCQQLFSGKIQQLLIGGHEEIIALQNLAEGSE